MSDEMIDNYREWLSMAEAERDAHKRKSEERKRALEEALSALAMADYYPSFVVPGGLTQQILKALED